MASLMKCLFLFLSVSSVSNLDRKSGTLNEQKYYIVYLGDQPVNKDVGVQTHIRILASVKGSDHDAKESIVYSYTKRFNAFAAKLSIDEAQKLKSVDRLLSVFPNRYHKIHTTKSSGFLGHPQRAKRKLKVESNIIIGLLDTGITPQSESFKDKGFGPPPPRWKGICGHFPNFSGWKKEYINLFQRNFVF